MEDNYAGAGSGEVLGPEQEIAHPATPPNRYYLHITLFILTVFTTTLAGVFWLNKEPFNLDNFRYGLPYAISILAILSAHEFGHYFAARFHGVSTTLPFYIPFPPFIPWGSMGVIQLNPFGTMGAVIRIRTPLQSKKVLFDVGIAGPLAGLVVTFVVLAYGIISMPDIDYLYSIHPEYLYRGGIPTDGLTFGNSLFFWGMMKFASLRGFVPPMNEIYHYPYLCAGWFGLFVTALNLLPVGQLDGGHILYALIGDKQKYAAWFFFSLLVLFGLASALPLLGFKVQIGTTGWILWAFILYFLIKVEHPPIYDIEPLGRGRVILGWLTMIFFLFIFPPVPMFEP
jgi:membrane-associated protease RseP (regulator of RpoE activity)